MKNERGFTLIELLVSTTIMLLVLASAMGAFRDALNLNNAGTLIADSNQNLRAAANLMIRDLMQAGRGIPTGGVPIPSGGAAPINRPGPANTAYTFDNVNLTTLPAIVPGPDLGPQVDGQSTDIVTLLMTDSTLPPLTLNATPVVAGQATLSNDGSSMTIGPNAAWANPATGVHAGDLIMFTNAFGAAVQTATSFNGALLAFSAGDWFGFNQRGAVQGSITQILSAPVQQTTAQRILMITYYVDNVTSPGTPRLARRTNDAAGQALAGVVEDLDLSFDLVDGVINPSAQRIVPVTINAVRYTPNQIRKVNLHVGVRSEQQSVPQHAFVRNHLTTVVSVRSLAYVDRYQ